MPHETRISAKFELRRPTVCTLTVEEALYPQGSAYFPHKDAAKGSWLAERLFEIEDITAVRIAGHEVSVTRTGEEDWRPVTGKVAEIIQVHLGSGKPAVSPAYQPTTQSDSEIKKKVQAIFDTNINPAVASHGGQVDLLDVKDRKVYLRMGGGCQGCGMANVTLRQGIEAAIREQVPEVEDILDTTDHAAGNNPYYTPSEK